MQVFVHAPEDFTNLCVLARTLEVLGVRRCFVHDPHRLVRPRYGKSYTRRLQAVSAGAFFRVEFAQVADPIEFVRSFPGRAIATVPDQSATGLYGFAFGPDDLLVFGSEGAGLPAELIAACGARLTIPQRGITQSLNLCVASGIILAECFRQSASPPPVARPTPNQALQQTAGA